MRYGLENEMNAVAEKILESRSWFGSSADEKKLAKFHQTLEYVMRDTWGIMTSITLDQTREMMHGLGYRRVKSTSEFDAWKRDEEIINIPIARGGTMDMTTNQKMAAWTAVAKNEFRRVEYLLAEVLLRNSVHKEFSERPMEHVPAVAEEQLQKAVAPEGRK